MVSPSILAMQQLSGPTRAVAEFERLGLMNRAVIDAVAVDVPLVTLANNKTDRWERFVRQAIVLAVGFLIAPIHAKLISKHFSRQIGFAVKHLNEKLLQLSLRDLENIDTLKTGIKQLFKEELQEKIPDALNRQVTESLRKKIVSAKSKFLITDLAVLCTLFSSVGFIRVLAGKMISGKEQFSGELGVVEQQKLDALYEQERGHQKLSKRMKEILTLSLGLLLPTAIGASIWKDYLTPGKKGIIKRIAPFFDYVYPRTARFLQSWPMMSIAGLVLSNLILTVGELAAARSKREFKTLAIQRNSIDGLFFFGTPLLMMLFNRGAHSVQDAIQKTATTTNNPLLLKKAANRSAHMFGISFILNMLAVAGIVTLTNQLTKKQVKKAASMLPSPETFIRTPAAFIQFTNQ
jgi:hypothetical protein